MKVMSDFKRVALFLKPSDEVDEAMKLKRLHDFIEGHSDYVVTITLRSESEFLEAKENFDIILTTDTIYLPIAGIEIIRV